MGRTLPSITQAFLQEQQSLLRFRRALRRQDQLALDDLLAASRHHLAAAAYASHLLPFETMLLAMLVEEHKQVLELRRRIEQLESCNPGLSLPPPGNGEPDDPAGRGDIHRSDNAERNPPATDHAVEVIDPVPDRNRVGVRSGLPWVPTPRGRLAGAGR